MGFVLGVPVVFDASELFRGVLSTEGEMALGVIGLAVCGRILALSQSPKP